MYNLGIMTFRSIVLMKNNYSSNCSRQTNSLSYLLFFQLEFVGTVGTGSNSDIAIDAISTSDGECGKIQSVGYSFNLKLQ